jgi:outer membrane protein TolC
MHNAGRQAHPAMRPSGPAPDNPAGSRMLMSDPDPTSAPAPPAPPAGRRALRRVALTLLLAGSAGAAEPVRLTLEDAIAAALANNLRLARDELGVRRRELDIEAAQSVFDPSYGPVVSAAAPGGSDRQWTYGLQASQALVYGTRVRAAATLSDRPGADSREGAWTLDLTQPLFRRFGRAVAEEPIHAGRDQFRAAQRAWEMQKADLILRLISLFEVITRLDAQAEFEQRFIDSVGRLYTLMQARERQGRATHMDVLRLDIQRGEAGARLANVRERRAIAARELAEALGAPPETEFALDAPPVPAADLPAAAAAVQAALTHRMDHAQAVDDAHAAGRRETIAQRHRWPDVSFSLSLRREHEDGLVDAARNGQTAWFATATSEGYPWRRADRLVIAQAHLDRAAAEATIDIVRQGIAREILQALAECRRTQAEETIAERNRRLAEHAALAGRRLFSSGRADGLSLSDAETRLAESENRLFEARSAARFSHYALRHTMGTLIEHPRALTAAPAEEEAP